MSTPRAPRRLRRTLAAIALPPLLALALAATACITVNLPGVRLEPLVETVVAGERGPKILLLEIDGVIREAPEAAGFLGTTTEGTVARVREELDRARADDEVRALLLRINSPGGTVTGSDVIHREIRRFKEERGLPVVAQLMGLATSGGYYVALAADRIQAQPTTVTGSIGVIFTSVNVAGLMEKIGVEDQTLTSGEQKGTGSILRRMRPEERAHLQSVLDDLYERFLATVREGRPDLGAEDVQRVADGRIFSASQALELGLVDGVGFLEDAVDEAERRAGLETSRVVTYHRPREYESNLYTRPAAPRAPDLRVLPAWLEPRGPSFLYLWAPGPLE